MYEKLFLALIDSSSAHAEASRKIFSTLALSEGQPKILYILRRQDGLMQKNLAALCGIRESTLTTLLSKLDEKGLVRRERKLTTTGKSSFAVFLTEEGRKIAERLEQEVERLEECSFRGFSREERETLLSMLSRITHNLRENETQTR